MKIRAFVILSSLCLFSWLTATFVRVVPMHTYEGVGVTAEADVAPEGAEMRVPVAVLED
ncbi:MAG: hypothetical protein OSA48_03950 [Akkermansiaceae bacterium]|jgi:hypothetical protein|nr:hypothetical protein [Akkermansiaceae bacterium]|tara:strand:- start:277 stop:453 length:177 start_codon:yes stop_codon:yes gene_type:complete